ncbi:MAG: hypothetical protein PUK59_01470 [Actinomycetaceae bacterium]|nr:hypothetical protein [Actinomycetaceae bacterium]MDY5854057.1 hypothetical protein [Arcanobacterium sp.]
MLTSLLLLAADPSDHTAQQWAENELAKSKYHEQETLLQRIIDWISELFSANIMAVGNRGTVTILLTVLVIIAAAVIALLVWRSVRARTGAASSAQLGSVGSQALFGDARSSDQLFAAAAQAQREHNYDMSVIELFRAVIRLLSERGELTLRPGLTATEAAEAAADKMGHRELFMRGAAWFNEVFFADLHADERSLADLEELADFVRSASSGSPAASASARDSAGPSEVAV